MGQQGEVLNDDSSYHSFMVRLWRVPERVEQLWRCEVEDIQSGEIVEVSSREDIFSLIGEIVKRDVEKPL